MSIITDLKKFALRGNLVDLAVGFTVGAAFTSVARSLVNDLIMPPIGLLVGRSDFSDLFLVLREGAKSAAPYATLADAQAAGAVTLNFGIFINNLLAFAVVTLAMFLLIRAVNRADSAMEKVLRRGREPEPEEPANKKCPHCLTTVPYRATRCPACTSPLEPEKAPD